MNHTDKQPQTVYVEAYTQLIYDGWFLSKSQTRKFPIVEVSNALLYTPTELQALKAEWQREQWISVKDRLPSITIDESKDLNESEAVIGLLSNGQVYKLRLFHWYESEQNDFNWCYDDCGEFCDKIVTHWMPLLQPPKH